MDALYGHQMKTQMNKPNTNKLDKLIARTLDPKCSNRDKKLAIREYDRIEAILKQQEKSNESNNG